MVAGPSPAESGKLALRRKRSPILGQFERIYHLRRVIWLSEIWPRFRPRSTKGQVASGETAA